MDFKKFNIRSMVLAGVAGLMLVFTLISKMAHGSTSVQTLGEPNTMAAPVMVFQPQPQVRHFISDSHIDEMAEDDAQSMRDMKEQMDNDRQQQKKIKMLKLQLEQTTLQLEQEKALSEISQLKKENTNVVDDSSDESLDKYPEVKVLYIGGTQEQKEAILSINGINYSVKEKNKPVKNVEVVAISDASVVVHFNLPQALDATIDYKPE